MTETASSNRLARWMAILAPVAVYLIAAGTGLWGIDYGEHWDEWLNLYKISQTVKTNVLLPHWYDYPAMIYWMSLLALAPSVPASLRSESVSLLAIAESQTYLIWNRVLFVLVSSLAVVWVYLAVLAWRKRRGEAAFAAALLGFSWEFAYHSRFVAPDAVMLQFGALALLGLVMAALRPEDRRWGRLAAVFCGLATATKYTAGVLIIPLLVVTALAWDRRSIGRLLVRLAEAAALFGFTYLVITPGTIIEPAVFVTSLRQVSSMYLGGHEMHTVAPGWEHFSRLLGYFTLEGFSHFRLLAAAAFALALAGTAALIRDSRRLALALLSFPLLFLAYFVLQGRVMIVRNVIIVLPFLAVLAARGLGLAWDALKDPRLRTALAAAAAALLVANAGWLAYAANTITGRGSDRFLRDFAAYADRRPQRAIFISGDLLADLEGLDGELPPNITLSPDGADEAAFYALPALGCLPANRALLPLRWFGPYEVNLRYYPNWPGDDHIVVMPVRAIEQAGMSGCLGW